MSLLSPASWLLLFVAALIGPGCAITLVPPSGKWTDEGYRHELFGYEVAFANASDKALLGPDWTLDNFFVEPGTGRLREMTSEPYRVMREINGERVEEPLFDLKYTSRRTDGVIWVKAHPLPARETDRTLDVILDRYADSLSGAAFYAQGDLFGVAVPASRRFVSFVTEKAPVPLGNARALGGTIEIAEADRTRHDPSHRSGVVRVVMAKLRVLLPIREHRLGPHPLYRPRAAKWPRVEKDGRSYHDALVLLVLGYHDAPGHFAKGLRDFDRLLAQVSFPAATVLPLEDSNDPIEPVPTTAETVTSAP